MRNTKWLYLTLAGIAASACETRSPSEPGALVPRTVAEDPSLPAIEMNGARFHLETFGNPANPVIVFLHGGPGGDNQYCIIRLCDYRTFSADDFRDSSAKKRVSAVAYPGRDHNFHRTQNSL